MSPACIPLNLLQLLLKLKTHVTEHSGRTLLDHLVGTFVILVSWDAAPTICLAGLTHSIYSTESFRSEVFPPTEASRKRLQTIVGEETEALVYLFAAKTGQTFVSQVVKRRHDRDINRADGGYIIEDRFSPCSLQVGARDLDRLAMIDLANALEQPNSFRRRLSSEHHKFRVAEAELSCPQALLDLENKLQVIS
jgi:hypothetical protein